MTQRSAYDPYDIENNKHIEGLRSGGWTVSSSPPAAKMKITRRKATSEYPEGRGGAARKPRRRPQAHQDESQLLPHQQQAMGVVRVCSDCNTTKTPLWSGPCGPKVNYQCNWEIKSPDLCSFEVFRTSSYIFAT
ncbi:unnamed protein product [Miscanthus lutarioriparius]|uniref:Uncharacterized protein n=1 Tax=Miscanthus lutarioriparius TaxID=422564 RepID=A0A811NKI5_9POAL|nr:unnamed protein product [Miscanthus lutarioriparius]